MHFISVKHICEFAPQLLSGWLFSLQVGEVYQGRGVKQGPKSRGLQGSRDSQVSMMSNYCQSHMCHMSDGLQCILCTSLRCIVYFMWMQVLQVSPSWESQAPKEMMVNQDPQESLDSRDSLVRWDQRVCVTTSEAATELPSKQVSCKIKFQKFKWTWPGYISIWWAVTEVFHGQYGCELPWML